MSKTAAFVGLNGLRDLLSDSMAIDMGAAATVIYVRGRGSRCDEPSLLAVDTVTGEVIAIGSEAQKNVRPRGTKRHRDRADGRRRLWRILKRPATCSHILARKARSSFSSFSRRALISVLAGITSVERAHY
jgi:rod shape-determining protein MreB